MQSPSSVRAVPPRKKLRNGQQRVLDEVAARISLGEKLIAVQLPTGYGKTLTAAAVFVNLYVAGVIDRLLYIVPTQAQLDQFLQSGGDDFHDAGLAGMEPVLIDGEFYKFAIGEHRADRRQVFVTTIQSLVGGTTGQVVAEMMRDHRWGVVIDEYHHYGMEKVWGRAARKLLEHAQILLAMSATPNRREQDSAFGDPHVRVTYREALREDAVKELELHAYEYRVDGIKVNGETFSFTTTELVEAAGGEDVESIDKYLTRVAGDKLRWSPKYIAPLVSHPIERLLARRTATMPLQMIVGAMSCLHAQLVCSQIQEMFGDVLRVDWVGTGDNGRDQRVNRAILRKFCPPKVDGVRRPRDIELDVLVHVGMAGEGLDSTYVTEVVHLNPARLNNQNDQENGRAARRVPHAPSFAQRAFINVDSSSAYAQWPGWRIMDAFDRGAEVVPEATEQDERDRERDEDWDMPREPLVVLTDCQLYNIDRGSPEVEQAAVDTLAANLSQAGVSAEDAAHLLDTVVTAIRTADHPDRDRYLDVGVAGMLRKHQELAQGQTSMSVVMQLREDVNSKTKKVASVATRLVARQGRPSLGEVAHKFFSQMKREFGCALEEADEAGLRARYTWVYELNERLKKNQIPPWLG